MKKCFSVVFGSLFSLLAFADTELWNTSPSQPRTGLGIPISWTVKYDKAQGGTYLSAEGTFEIYRDGILIATVSVSGQSDGGYVDYNTVAGQTYSYMVKKIPSQLAWDEAMKRFCVCSYSMTLDVKEFVVPPGGSMLSFDGTVTRYDYGELNQTVTTTTSSPVIKSIDCDWIRDVFGSKSKKVLTNDTGAVRTAHVTMDAASSLGISTYEQVITVTQLPDAVAANGRNTYWDCHVAGLDWDDPKSEFKAFIDMSSGSPVISWSPALNGDRVKQGVRTYIVKGTKRLCPGDAWEIVEDGHESEYNFFRVSVEMPK